MDDIVSKLEAYFASHSCDEIVADWEKTAPFDSSGLSVNEFLTQQFSRVQQQ